MSKSVESSVAERLRRAREKQAARTSSEDTNIPRLPDDAAIPMASGQHRLWFLHQIDAESPVYNVVSAQEISGPLQIDRLQRGLDAAIEQHETLRTRLVVSDEGAALQEIVPAFECRLEATDCEHEHEAAFRHRIQSDIEQPFDLAEASLFRAHLYRRADSEHVFLLVFHHAIFDGISVDLLLDQLAGDYALDEVPEKPEPAVRFRDYAAWHNQWLLTEDAERQLNFWVEQHGGADTPLELPLDFARPVEQTYRGAALRQNFRLGELDGFTQLVQEEKCSVFMALMSALSLTLHKICRQDAINIATPSSGRGTGGLESVLGFFANTLVFHVDVHPGETLRQHLRRVRDLCLAGYQHQDIPFDQLVNRIDPPRDTSRTPLFQVMLAYEEGASAARSLGDASMRPFETEINVARTDLTFWFEHHDGNLALALEYSTDLFAEATISRLVTHLQATLQFLAATPDAPVADLSLLNDDDKKLREVTNDTHREYPHRHAGALLLDTVQRYPDENAIIHEGVALTYGELQARVANLKHCLTAEGISAGDTVGIYLPRSADMVIAILAIWEAGAGYLPMDPEFPPSRLQYMLDRTGCKVLIAADEAPPFNDVTIVRPGATTATSPSSLVHQEPESAAYTIFTSGSTGNPKGVVVPQRAVANFLQSMQETPGFGPGNKLLAVTTLSFDISVLELLLPLASGGTVVIASRNDTMDGRALGRLISEHGVDTLQATPSTWRILLQDGWTAPAGFRALCGGEALPPDLADQIRAAGCRLWNMYGPTETTVWSTCSEILDDNVTLGSPIANTSLYVVDANRALCPAGVIGELAIGGDGVTLGYHDEPGLTADRFVSLTVPEHTKPVPVYLTGDLVRQHPDGAISYYGRDDHQVKIRGFRIETGDIEATLAGREEIREAVVVVRELDQNDTRLIAYLCFEPGASLSNIALRKFLNAELPAYMVPQQFVTIDAMPLGTSGKIDRKALMQRAHEVISDSRHVAPATPTEQAIAGIWCNLIGVEKVSATSAFFDAGGHSLLSIKAIQQIEKALGVRLGARDMMLNTLQQIAASVDRRAQKEIEPPREGEAKTGDTLTRVTSFLKNPFSRS